MLQTAQTGQIFERVVAASHDPVAVAAPIGYQKNREIMKADIVAELLKTPVHHEWGNAVTKDFETFVGHPRGYTYHILFGHTGVDETRAHHLAQVFKGIIAQIARDENDRIIGSGQFFDGLRKFYSHLFNCLTSVLISSADL